MLLMRAEADALSVKLAAVTTPLSRPTFFSSSLVDAVRGGAISAVTVNAPLFNDASRAEAGSV